MSTEPQDVIPLEYADRRSDPLRFVVRALAILGVIGAAIQLTWIPVEWWFRAPAYGGDVWWPSPKSYFADYFLRISVYLRLIFAMWLLIACAASLTRRRAGLRALLWWSYATVPYCIIEGFSDISSKIHECYVSALGTIDLETILTVLAFNIQFFIAQLAFPLIVVVVLRHETRQRKMPDA